MRVWCALVLVALVGMQSSAGADDKRKDRPKTPDVVPVAEDDKAMNAAMEKGRNSVDEFIKVFQKKTPEQSQFAVKIAVRDGKNVEHFWVGVTRFDGQKFTGRINNEPTLVKTVKEGQEVSVEKNKVEDWMYVEKRKLYGGYTIRLLRDRLSPAERKSLDESIPFKIE